MFVRIMYCLAGICAVGLSLSTAAHVLALLQIDSPGGRAVFWLIPGLFIIWPPLVLLGNWTRPPGFPKGSPDHIFAELPKWARASVWAVFIYAMLNFVLFFVIKSRYPRHEVPFFLEARVFTGHSMVFYGWGLAGYVGLARLARRRQSEPVDPEVLSAEKRPAKDLETNAEDDERYSFVPKPPTGKAGDWCMLFASAVWTLAWLGAACLAVARVARAKDDEAVAVLAIAALTAGFGCLSVLHFGYVCLQHLRAKDGAAGADIAAQPRDQIQEKDNSYTWLSRHRGFNRIVKSFFTVIWCGLAIVWTLGCFVAMLGVAHRGPSWFMLVMVPFSLGSLMLLCGLFAAIIGVIESLVRIFRRVIS